MGEKKLSVSDEVDAIVNKKSNDLVREAVIEVWGRVSKTAKNTAELLDLLKEPLFTRYLDALPLKVTSGGGDTGITRERVTPEEVEALRKAFNSCKATSKDHAKGRAQILEHVSGDQARFGERWQSILAKLAKEPGIKINKVGDKRNQTLYMTEK